MDPHRQSESLYRLPTYTHSAAQGVFLTALVPGAGRGAPVALLAAVVPLALPSLLGLYLAALAPVYPPLAFTRWSARYEGFAALAPAIAAGRRVLRQPGADARRDPRGNCRSPGRLARDRRHPRFEPLGCASGSCRDGAADARAGRRARGLGRGTATSPGKPVGRRRPADGRFRRTPETGAGAGTSIGSGIGTGTGSGRLVRGSRRDPRPSRRRIDRCLRGAGAGRRWAGGAPGGCGA